MKLISSLIVFALMLFCITGCDKNRDLSGSAGITGTLFIKDSLSPAVPLAAGNQIVYLSKGRDTSTYLMQLKTDSLGQYSTTSLRSGEAYTIYARFMQNGQLYAGASTFDAPDDDEVSTVNLTMFGERRNGMSLTFTDNSGGPIANLPFRLYTNLQVASLDSVRYSYLSAVSDLTGQYQKFNMPAIKYYIAASLDLGGTARKAIDSVVVQANGLAIKTIILK